MISELTDIYGPRTPLEYHCLPSLVMDLTHNASSGTSLVLHGLCSALPQSPVQTFHSPSAKTIIQQPTRSLTLPILIRCLQVSIVVLLFLEIKQAYITFYVKAPVEPPAACDHKNQVLTLLLKRNAHIVGPLTLAGRWLTGLLSGYRGDEMLRRGYEKVMLLLLRGRWLGSPMCRPKRSEACSPCRLWAGILSM